MRSASRLGSGWILSSAFAYLISMLLVVPTPAAAQCSLPAQGNNAVYNTTCNSPNATIVGSSAFIDASMFVGNAFPNNICVVLNYILSPGNGLPATGAVIDARGLNTTNTSMTCTGTPWSGIASPVHTTILLPAGTIAIPTTWILPNGTRVIGEGSTNPYDAITAVPQTTIQASSSLTGAMIQFGDSSCPSPGCVGVTLAGGPLKPVFGLSGAVPRSPTLPLL